MSIKPGLWVLGALICLSASLPASAQAIYKCGSRKSPTYTERACSGRIYHAGSAALQVQRDEKQVDAHRAERNRVMARSLRPRTGESPEQFETRRRRARLMAEDRDECDRLDVRMPVEQASMINPDPAQVQKAETALGESRKRFSQLHC
jgi:hypothetical protein